MDYYENYADERQLENCLFCYGEPETKEHVPSKVFLDKPYPDRLYTINICSKCNNGFSIDEEYLACLIECAKCNSLKIENLERKSIKKTLKHTPALLNTITNSLYKEGNKFIIDLTDERLQKICLKLAKCHIFYDFSVPLHDEKYSARFYILPMLSKVQRDDFEAVYELTKYPEVGSRAANRICICGNFLFLKWNIIQEERYRYYVNCNNGYQVKIVIREFLACEFNFYD